MLRFEADDLDWFDDDQLRPLLCAEPKILGIALVTMVRIDFGIVAETCHVEDAAAFRLRDESEGLRELDKSRIVWSADIIAAGDECRLSPHIGTSVRFNPPSEPKSEPRPGS